MGCGGANGGQGVGGQAVTDRPIPDPARDSPAQRMTDQTVTGRDDGVCAYRRYTIVINLKLRKCALPPYPLPSGPSGVGVLYIRGLL